MRLFRKRFYPDEVIELNDEILFWDGRMLVTKWQAIRSKPNLSNGISMFLVDKGVKISKFYREDGSLVYWYCDVGDFDIDTEKNVFTFIDLLADVIVYPNGEIRVVDLAEAADIFESGKIDSDIVCKMLRRLDFLLETVHSGEFINMQKMLESYEQNI